MKIQKSPLLMFRFAEQRQKIKFCFKIDWESSLRASQIFLFPTGADYSKNLNQFNLVFRSPGVPYNLPEIQKAVKTGIETSSVTKLFFKEAKKLGCKIVGVSGINGKGTTATLIYRMLKAGGRDVFLPTSSKMLTIRWPVIVFPLAPTTPITVIFLAEKPQRKTAKATRG